MALARNRRRVVRRADLLPLAGTVAAGTVCACLLVAAPLAALLALAGGPADTVTVAGIGLGGAVVFAAGPVAEWLLAPLLVVTAAHLWMTMRPGAWLALAGFFGAVALGLLAASPDAVGFGAALALGLAVALPAVRTLALAGLPLLAVSLVMRLPAVPDAEAARAIGWLVVAFASLAMPAAGLVAARAGRLAVVAGASAVGLAALALAGSGLAVAGALPGAGWAIAREAAAAVAFGPAILALSAAILRDATGTDALDWLGGLARGMPVFAACLLSGCFALAFLPPGPAFAALRSLIAASAGAAAGARVALAAVAVAASLFAALSGFAALRGFAFVCLGRPRSLRAASAEEIGARARDGLVLLAVAAAIAGLADGASLYRPAALAVLMVLVVLIARAAIRRRPGPADVADWRAGAGRPPSWLPFGDPAAQVSASGFAPQEAAWLPALLRAGRQGALRGALARLFAP